MSMMRPSDLWFLLIVVASLTVIVSGGEGKGGRWSINADNAQFMREIPKTLEKGLRHKIFRDLRFNILYWGWKGRKHDWTYGSIKGPKSTGKKGWGKKFFTCEAKYTLFNYQLSPTRCADDGMNTIKLTPDYRARHEISWGSSWKECGRDKFTIENNGHTVRVNFPRSSPDGKGKHNYLFIPKGVIGLAGRQFHFHFPKSEHIINGKQYDAEIQMYMDNPLHGAYDYWAKPKPLTDSRQRVFEFEPRKIHGLAFMIEVDGSNTNDYFQEIIDHFPAVSKPGKIAEMQCIDMFKLIGKPIDGGFFHYNGSLTTPPCYQVVEWRVYKRPIKISEAQFDAFKEIQTWKHDANEEKVPDEFEIMENVAPAYNFNFDRFKTKKVYIWPPKPKEVAEAEELVDELAHNLEEMDNQKYIEIVKN